MVGMFGQKVPLAQANGPDVELVVSGTELYATYHTAEGYPAVYDDGLGLFCYAKTVQGRFASTGVSVTSSAPAGVTANGREADAVRAEKIRDRETAMDAKRPR